jgi:hypothetical protein
MNRLKHIFTLISFVLWGSYNYGDNTLKLGIDVLEEAQFNCFKKDDKIILGKICNWRKTSL